MIVMKKGNKLKILHGLLTKEEICQICSITSEEFDYHMPLLMKAGLVNCYVEK